MPRHLAPPNFADTVLSRLPENQVIARPVLPQRARWPAFVGVSVAAGVLFAVCAGVWLMVALPRPAARTDQRVARAEQAAPDVTLASKDPPPAPAPTNSPVMPPPETANVAAARASPMQPKTLPENSPVAGNELASPPLPLPEPAHFALPRLPEVYTAQVLDQSAAKADVAQELAKSESHRLDLFCKDSNRALERLQAAFKERGVRVAVDAQAAEMQKRKMREFYAIYCDDMTAAEWVALLQSLSKTDRKAEEKKPGDGVLDQLVVMPLGANDQKDLVGLFGSDPTAAGRPKGPDPRRPIADDTGDQVAKALGKSEGAKGQKQALVLPYWPVRSSPAVSKETKQFTETGHDRRPETIAVLLIVRFPN
jgi:hypothetical protein